MFTDLTLLCPVAVVFLCNSLADGFWLTVFFMIVAIGDLIQSNDCGGFGKCTRPPAAGASDFVLNY